MDPLTIATGTLALLTAVGQATLTITSFLRACGDAPTELVATAHELSDLRTVLLILQHDTTLHPSTTVDDDDDDNSKPAPTPLHTQILTILTNCLAVVSRISAVLETYHPHLALSQNTDTLDVIEKNESPSAGPSNPPPPPRRPSRLLAIKYVTTGKSEIAALRGSLEAHRASLSLALDLMSLSLSKSIRDDTAAMRVDTSAQLERIMEELGRLQGMVEGMHAARTQPGGGEGAAGEVREGQTDSKGDIMLQRYLDDLTSYAETVWGDEEGQAEERDRVMTPETEDAGEEGEEEEGGDEDEEDDVVAGMGTLGLSLSNTQEPEVIVWYGQIKLKPGQANEDAHFSSRWELSESAYYGRWSHVFDILETRQKYFGETWANCWRIPKAGFWAGATKGFTPLHQAAYHGSSLEVVQRLIQLGAWRFSRTLQTSGSSPTNSTPYDIARELGATHLLDILTPRAKRPVSGVVLRNLQMTLHTLIRETFADHHSVHLDCFVLPSLEPLMEFMSAAMWFPLEPEDPSPDKGMGVLIDLGLDEQERYVLDVEIHVGKVVRRLQRFRISMQGVQSING